MHVGVHVSLRIRVFYGYMPGVELLDDMEISTGGLAVKDLPANAGDTDVIPGPGRFHTLWTN